EALGSIGMGESLVRLAHAETLFAVGETERAVVALADAQTRLLARASRIVDPQSRRAFLENDPDNPRTLALAREHGPWLNPDRVPAPGRRRQPDNRVLDEAASRQLRFARVRGSSQSRRRSPLLSKPSAARLRGRWIALLRDRHD